MLGTFEYLHEICLRWNFRYSIMLFRGEIRGIGRDIPVRGQRRKHRESYNHPDRVNGRIASPVQPEREHPPLRLEYAREEVWKVRSERKKTSDVLLGSTLCLDYIKHEYLRAYI